MENNNNLQYKLIGSGDLGNITETFLKNRGIYDIDKYLYPTIEDCNEYSALNNIQDAVNCFVKHIDKKDDVAILVDPDCDGYTSASLIYNYIKRLCGYKYMDHVHYIIHKNNKVHGLSKMKDGDFDIPKSVKLFIIPDAGTNDVIECNELIKKGIDIIILDHHQQENSEVINNAIIVNNQISDNYSDKNFSGVGIVYEFTRALDEEYMCDLSSDFLDLVAFGNVADDMSLLDIQTRYYVTQGCLNINNRFLKALNEVQSFSTNGRVNSYMITWYWAPICNAMIRIGSYEDRDLLFRAFIETDEVFDYVKRGLSYAVDETIYDRAARLCKNIKSKQDRLRDSVFDNIMKNIEETVNHKAPIIVVNDADPGIVGLSCVKLANTIGKPCIVVKDVGDGLLGGSGRNCNGSPIDDFKTLVGNIEFFSFAQGHPNAFGCMLLKENLDKAQIALDNAIEDVIEDEDYNNIIDCDFVIQLEDLTYDFFYEIDKVQWLIGKDVGAPVVAIEGVKFRSEDSKIMGKNNDSLSFQCNGIKYCLFKVDDEDPLMHFAKFNNGCLTINLIGECSVNFYQGQEYPQVIINSYSII